MEKINYSRHIRLVLNYSTFFPLCVTDTSVLNWRKHLFLIFHSAHVLFVSRSFRVRVNSRHRDQRRELQQRRMHDERDTNKGRMSMGRRVSIYSAFLYIKNSISWYQEIIHTSWYKKKIEFLISRNNFLISRNRFLDIEECILRRRFTIF